MAKKVRFPLDMGDEKKVRTIDDLRANFNAEKLVGHFYSGKLQAWLLDRHCQSEYEQVMELDISSENFLWELCAVFQVVQDFDSIKDAELLEKVRLVKALWQFTNDEEILRHLDRLATNQEQLNGLLKQGYTVIYLFGESFEIPGTLKNVRLEGINTPGLRVKTDKVINFKAKGVDVLNCIFYENYRDLQELKKIQKNAHKKKRKNYTPSAVLDYKLSDEGRKGSSKLFNKIQDGLVDFEFDIDRL